MRVATRFSGPLQVERLDNGDRKLLRDLVIDLGVDLGLGDGELEGFSVSADGTRVTVPKGFTTDFSSIPAFARALYRFDSVDLAGCCHDYAYYVGVPRPEADEIWRLVAISGTRRVSRFRGRLGWIALRLGGWPAYRSHAKRRRAREARASALPTPASRQSPS
jgi:hypothetical protein